MGGGGGGGGGGGLEGGGEGDGVARTSSLSGTASADRQMPMRSIRCGRSSFSSGLNVAMSSGRQGWRTESPSRSTVTVPVDSASSSKFEIDSSSRLMSSTYSTPRCALASSPGSKIVFPVLTDFSTSTAPRSRSSSTSSGTCTKGAGTTSVSRLSIVNSPLRSCSSRKESYSPEAGSLLNWLPFITSIGGSNLWIARAITDFAVPREPEMTTPPIFGFTPQRSSAVLIASWPTTAASGNVAGPEFRSVNAALCLLRSPSLSSAAVISPATAIARSIASVVVMHTPACENRSARLGCDAMKSLSAFVTIALVGRDGACCPGRRRAA